MSPSEQSAAKLVRLHKGEPEDRPNKARERARNEGEQCER
jgi:hypothetical protein